MDTIETTTEPVGGEGATSSQDTSAQVDTQPAKTEEVVSANESGEAGDASESLLAGKYKTPQELEKAYQEAEKLNGQLSQKARVANLIQEQYGLTPEQFEQRLAQQKEAQIAHEIQTNPAGYALQEVANLKNQLALQAEEKELDGFLQKNPEYAPFREKLFNLGLKVETTKPYDEIAREYFGEARAQGQKDAYQKIETKKQTQATGTSTASKKTMGYGDLQDLPRAERLKAFEQMQG